MAATEDGITDLMAGYLRNQGISAVTQISISTAGSRDQPDYQIENGGKFLGEAKWESEKWEGFGEARDYGQLPGISGSFLITYPEKLREEGSQARLGEKQAESVLDGHTYSCAFLRRDEATDMAKLELEDIPEWLESNIEERHKPEPDPEEIVSILRQTAYRLNENLETAPDENIFRNVLGASPNDKDLQDAAKQSAGFLLVNQLTFYRVLSSTRRFPEIEPDQLDSPADLSEYFDAVLDEDYTPVFSFQISEELPQAALPLLKDAIKTIYAVSPENINHDILGKVFHELIPFEVRKEIAAYYTMNKSADILARLAIEEESDEILDPACGSGSILTSAYLRKKSLAEGFSEKDHQRYVEDDLMGIDAMPFAAHMSCIHLALQAPIYDTDEVNIGIEDSTKLHPGKEISPLSFILPESESQRGLAEYNEGKRPDISDETIETGSITMDAAMGRKMDLEKTDVVFMNPPFSRQESVAGFTDNYKTTLRDRFDQRDRHGQIHGKMNFSSYFLFLADRFLDEDGRIASVLNASILTNSSDAGVREMLLEEYTVEYIITREDESNFSEDTEHREILLIARKGHNPDETATFVTLKTLNTDPDEIAQVEQRASVGEEIEVEDFRLRKATLSQLDVHNMFAPLSVQDPHLLNLWEEVNKSDSLTQIQNLDTGLIRGGSSHPWQDGVVCDPSTEMQNEDLWEVVSKSNSTVTTEHQHTKDKVEIPRSKLQPYFLRYAHRKEIDVSDIDEYVITDTDFDDYQLFKSLGGGDDIPQGWKDHVEKAQAHTCIQRRCNLTAPGTSQISIYTENPRTYHRMWCFSDLNEAEAKIFTVWFNSSFNLMQLIFNRSPNEGGWTNYRRFSIDRFSTVNPSALDNDTKSELIEVFENIREKEFPSLVEQYAQNTSIESLTDEEYRRLKDAFGTDLAQKVGEGFEASKVIDEAIMDAIGFSDQKQKEMQTEMYPKLLMELVSLREIM